MTVNYNLCVATSHPWTLLRILLRWRGSLWKAVGIQAAIWSILFCLIHIAQRDFKTLLEYWISTLKTFHLILCSDFFVTVIVTRWSTLFNNIGLIENLAHTISACVRGSDDKTRTRRRNIIRYSVVAQLLAFRDISVQVRKRFPTMDTVVASGFLMSHELKELEGLNSAAANMGKHGCLYGKTWIPIEWAITLLKKARYEDETISSDILLSKCLEEIRRFRTNLLTLTNYDWVPLPIMYPQLVTLAVHLFFFIALFSRASSPLLEIQSR
ncbi:bestrophin-3 domain protein [Cooperia oncophora]